MKLLVLKNTYLRLGQPVFYYFILFSVYSSKSLLKELLLRSSFISFLKLRKMGGSSDRQFDERFIYESSFRSYKHAYSIELMELLLALIFFNFLQDEKLGR